MTGGFTSLAPPRPFAVAWLAGAVRAQRWMWSEAWCRWRGRALPSTAYARRLGAGQCFALQRGSWMGVFVPMVVFTQFVDVLVAQGFIHVIATGRQRLALHALLLFGSLWTVVWAVSLRSAMRQVEHRLDAHALTLAIGFKHLCRIPLAAIADTQVIERRMPPGKDWYDACGLKPRDVSVLSFLDKPTLLITLDDAAGTAWWTRNGVRAPLRHRIAVYVDEPAAMRAAIVAAGPVTPGKAH